MVSGQDRGVIRDLATQWMAWAANPIMQERKEAWRAVHDLRARRPVILVETDWIEGYVREDELRCEDPFLRSVELNMRIKLRQAEELDDDIVFEPYYRLGWKLLLSDYGVPVAIHSAPGPQKSMAYSFSFPIATPNDVDLLTPRTFDVDRQESLWRKRLLEDIVGAVLPVRLGNIDPFVYEFDCGPYGDLGFTGNFFFGLTWQVYRFIGNQGLLYWVYDAPDAIHRLMQYMLDDRLAFFDFLEREELIAPNTDSQMAGPRMYGYVSDLPDPDTRNAVTLKNLWGWAESQEAANISPEMYNEFVLPYLAKLSERFGLVYYGCCERVDDRLPGIIEAIPNLRSVSISGWTNFWRAAELLGNRYVYSRKPTPAHISGPQPHWDLLEKDMRDTYAAARDCNLEILYRDIYTIDGDRSRLRRWVDMTKAMMQM